MEELRKWEETQRIILLMEDHGFPFSIAENSSSRRFLAELVIFLVKPCGDVDVKKKIDMTFYAIREISASLIDEASLVVNVADERYAHQQLQPREDPYNFKPFVGMDAMQRANSTLEDFCRSYFMFHDLDVKKSQDVFKYLPALSFTESYIYQMDAVNEKALDATNTGACFEERVKDLDDKWVKRSPLEPLARHLEYCGLMTQRIGEEFNKGLEYWHLERNLCSALINHKQIDDVMRAITLKSFDYRVLNLLLYQLRGKTVNELHMDFLSVSEFLVEVSDDLFDYEDDVLNNNFNLIRMLVNIYGISKAPEILLKYITEAEKKYDDLLKFLELELAFNYQKRCEEATRDGGKLCGYSFGTWTIPRLISDEYLYRMQHRGTTC